MFASQPFLMSIDEPGKFGCFLVFEHICCKWQGLSAWPVQFRRISQMFLNESSNGVNGDHMRQKSFMHGVCSNLDSFPVLLACSSPQDIHLCRITRYIEIVAYHIV